MTDFNQYKQRKAEEKASSVQDVLDRFEGFLNQEELKGRNGYEDQMDVMGMFKAFGNLRKEVNNPAP